MTDALATTSSASKVEDLYHRFEQSHPLRLGFPQPLESEFQASYAERYHFHIQMAGMLGLVALVISAPWDYLVAADIAPLTWEVRIIASIILMLSLAYSTSTTALRHQQSLIVANACISYLTLLLISEHHHHPYTHYYAIGSILVLEATFVISRLQFYSGLICAGIMLGALTLHLFVWMHADTELITIQYFVFGLAISFALPGCYLMEHSLRQNYLQARMLGREQQSLEETHLQLQALTMTDGLTHIANRRCFDNALSQEWSRQLRSESPLSVLMIDVDYFKQFNDRYGHQGGDDCLRQIATTLSSHARRPGDIAARYGGEEFTLILPLSRQEDAESIAQQICQSIATLQIPHEGSPLGLVTVSIGVATMIPLGQIGPEQLLMRADEALYQAKHAGRNQVMTYRYEEKSTS